VDVGVLGEAEGAVGGGCGDTWQRIPKVRAEERLAHGRGQDGCEDEDEGRSEREAECVHGDSPVKSVGSRATMGKGA
jgi:hypothetical protein